MKSWMMRAMGAAAVAMAAQGAMAQESSNRVATMTDWSVFAEESPKECWGVSSPKETVNTRDGQPVSVRRGDILLFVTFRPGSPGAISFSGGYPFAAGSTVNVDIDAVSYTHLDVYKRQDQHGHPDRRGANRGGAGPCALLQR